MVTAEATYPTCECLLRRIAENEAESTRLRRCDQLLLTATRVAVRFPRAIADLLRSGLRLRDHWLEVGLSDHGLANARDRLWHRLMDLVRPVKTYPGNERFACFSWTRRADLLPYLDESGLDATNCRAEQAV